MAKVFDFELVEEDLHILMEFCEEGTLLAYFNKINSTQKSKQILDIFSQLVEAGITMVDQGILHRDLKPDNIMFKQHEGKPLLKVVDFGEARRIPKS